MKKLEFLIVLLLSFIPASACISCNQEISDGIRSSTNYSLFPWMLSAFVVLAIVVILLYRYDNRKLDKIGVAGKSEVPMATAALILGIGIGGFIDGIVFHQILQWHAMLSNKIPSTNYIGKSVNMFWDGIFHAFCLIVVLIGILKWWKVQSVLPNQTSGKLLIGGLIGGWGVFNLIEGIINHQLLRLHHVMQLSDNHNVADAIFLISSIFLLIIGFLVMRKASIKEPL